MNAITAKHDKKKVQFIISTEEEDTSMYTQMKECMTRSEITKWLKDHDTNPWRWCSVKVTAKLGKYKGSAYLGGCAYESQADFEKGGYLLQMQKDALIELQEKINRYLDKTRAELKEQMRIEYEAQRAEIEAQNKQHG